MNIKNHFSPEYIRAVAIGLFVTFLWSTSFIIIKIGLNDIQFPPLLFGAFRYVLASLILLIIVLSKAEYRKLSMNQNSRWWLLIVIYGIIYYTITMSTQYIGLKVLYAVTVSLLYNFTPIFVLFFSIFLLSDRITLSQVVLTFVCIIGVIIYFYPLDFATQDMFGVAMVSFGVIANALSAIIGRIINKPQNVPPIVITAYSMVIGSVLLLIIGLFMETIPYLPLTSLIILIVIVGWLAVVNTALAFPLWNKILQTLHAIDTSLINSTMLPQITILSIIFLNEQIEFPWDWIGLIIVFSSVLWVQLIQAGKKQH